jgi:inorganic pyrophosphatase
MSKKQKRNKWVADPSRLAPLDADQKELIQVIIETPKGSRNKYAFDPEDRIFALKKVLPAGMTFPYDFGFVPSTVADDGDAVDVLVLMDEPAFPGCLLKCRIVGIIQGEQGEGKDRERNDRIIAIEQDNHSFASIEHVDDLGKVFARELEEFFVNYHALTGEKYRILALKGPREARKGIKRGRSAFNRGSSTGAPAPRRACGRRATRPSRWNYPFRCIDPAQASNVDSVVLKTW